MQKFKYTAKNASGSQVSGSTSAASELEAVQQLRKQSLTILTIKPESASMFSFNLFGSKDPRPHVKNEDMVLFTRQMATMIGAGIPLLESLEVQAEQVSDKGFKCAIRRIAESVRTGSDLSTALGLYPKIFKPIYSQYDQGRRGLRTARRDPRASRRVPGGQRRADAADQGRPDLPRHLSGD